MGTQAHPGGVPQVFVFKHLSAISCVHETLFRSPPTGGWRIYPSSRSTIAVHTRGVRLPLGTSSMWPDQRYLRSSGKSRRSRAARAAFGNNQPLARPPLVFRRFHKDLSQLAQSRLGCSRFTHSLDCSLRLNFASLLTPTRPASLGMNGPEVERASDMTRLPKL